MAQTVKAAGRDVVSSAGNETDNRQDVIIYNKGVELKKMTTKVEEHL